LEVVDMHTWQLQEAKNKFSEVVDRAAGGEPQVITRHGVEVAVVLSIPDYRRITAPRQSLVDFLRKSPLAGSKLEITRDQGPERPPVDL